MAAVQFEVDYAENQSSKRTKLRKFEEINPTEPNIYSTRFRFTKKEKCVASRFLKYIDEYYQGPARDIISYAKSSKAIKSQPYMDDEASSFITVNKMSTLCYKKMVIETCL